MKPLQLDLQAFGSYGGHQSVDLARLGGHGVFSITGPTGAGKSTIFDAIVFALYGDLPGFRTNSHVRSQHAPPDLVTSVTFSFAAGGREWQITRQPKQEVPRQHGPGTRTLAAQLHLGEVGADGGGWTTKKEVDHRIAELIGLDQAQFQQVVLIPQGRFEEVLKVGTAKRRELLLRLFPVDTFQRVTEVLQAKAGEAEAAYQEVVTSRLRLVDRVEADLAAARAALSDAGSSDAGAEGGSEHGDGDDTGPAGTGPGDDAPSDLPEADPDGDGDGTAPTAGGDGDVAAGGLGDELDRLRASAAALTTRVDTARADHDRARQERVAAEEAVAAWEGWQADLTAAKDFSAAEAEDAAAAADLERARVVARLAGALDQWRRASQDLDTAEAARTAAWADVEALGGPPVAGDGTVDDPLVATETAGRLGREAEALAEAEGERTAIVDEEAGLGRLDEELAARSQGLDTDEERHRTAEAALEVARAATAELTGQAAGLGEAQAAVTRCHEALAAARDRADATAEQLRRQEQAAAAAVAQEAASAELATVTARWRAGLGGRLALRLVTGDPCPTCGSTEHPAPAPVEEDAPDDHDLEVAEARLTSATTESARARAALAESDGRLAGLPVAGPVEEAAAAMAEATARCTALESVAEAAARQEAEVAEEVRRLDDEGRVLQQRRSDLDADRAAARASRAAWEERKQRHLAAGRTLESAADEIDRLRARAGAFSVLAQALGRRQQAAADRAAAEALLVPAAETLGVDGPEGLAAWARDDEDIATEEQRLASRLADRRDVQRRIEVYETAGRPADRPDPGPLAAAEEVARTIVEQLTARSAAAAERLHSAGDGWAGLAGTADALDAARRSKEEAETVASVCAGASGGPVDGRRSLVDWVLATYLRKVLAQANQRLDHMSQGRYTLVIDETTEDNRKATGLDLAVIDAETGQTRPATTLSGGETFVAALALALGLADVVSAGSNATIGALFVDEGFGSLDAGSLDNVVDVLRSLQDGGRMVGVISHVQEVKDALPNGIAVRPSPDGSRADIRYPDA